jgi:hypothetical protein
MADATGWVLFVGTAGPNPSDEGQMYMETQVKLPDYERKTNDGTHQFLFQSSYPNGG